MSDVTPPTDFDGYGDPVVEEQKPEELPPLEQSTDQLASLQAERGGQDPEEEDEDPFVEVRGTKFHVVAELPGAVSLSLARLKDKKVPDAEKASIINNVITFSVVPAERPDFSLFLMEAEPIIDMNELMEILQKLVEKVVGRPTQ